MRTLPPLTLALLSLAFAGCSCEDLTAEVIDDEKTRDAGDPATIDGGAADVGNPFDLPDGSVPNRPPVVAPTAVTPVLEGTLVTLHANATDPDGDPLRYEWSQGSPEPVVSLTPPDSSDPTFTAPLVSSDQILTFRVKVCDDHSQCTFSAILKLVVRNANQPPVAKLLAPANALPGEQILLDASSSTDPEGDAMTFAISQTGGSPTVTLTAAAPGSRATFTAPTLAADTTLTFSVTVCDQLVACSTKSAAVHVFSDTGLYVSSSLGADSNAGSRLKPFRTIGRAITEAGVRGGAQRVSIDRGDYPENPTLIAGVDLICGFDSSASWTRPPGTVTRIRTSSAAGLTFPAGASGTLDGCTVSYAGGAGSTAATVTVKDASPTLLGCTLDATASGTRPSSTLALSVSGSGGTNLVTVTDGRITGGNGTTSAFGIKISGVKLKLSGTTVTGGVAGNDGAAAVGVEITGDNNGTAIPTAVTISGATTTITGGAAGSSTFGASLPYSIGVEAIGAGATVQLSEATVNGGSGLIRRAVRLESVGPSTVSKCKLYGGANSAPQAQGAGISTYASGSNVTIDQNVSISGGTGVDGAQGIIVRGGGSPTITRNDLIKGGDAGADLIGILVESGSPTIDQNTLIVGGPGGTSGRGITLYDGAPLISRSVIRGAESNARAARAFGVSILGNVLATGSATAKLSDNVLIEGGGGTLLSTGVQLEKSDDVSLLRNTIRGGSSPGSNWGIADGTFSSSSSGGSGPLTLDANVVTALSTGAPSSLTPSEAGGLFLRGSQGEVTNNRVLGGPGLRSFGIQIRFADVDFLDNYAAAQGGSSTSEAYGFHVRASATLAVGKFVNNIFDGGRKGTDRFAFYEDNDFFPITFKNNDFLPDPGGALYSPATGPDKHDAAGINGISGYSGNMDVDPKFTADFHLLSNSPLKGKGQGTSGGAPAKDMDGDSRPSSNADIGPDEIP